jgi:hypothetical protein
MKKVLLFALVMLVSIAFVGAGFAQEKAKPAAEKPAVEKPEPAKDEKPAEAKDSEKAAEKPKPKPVAGFVGKVTKTESVFKTITVQRGKDEVAFDVSDAKLKGYKNLDEINVGDKVAIQYKKGAMTVVKIAGAKKAKAEKKEAVAKPKKEKKEAAADEQKPAEEKKPAKKDKKAAKDEKKEEKKDEKK